MINLYEVLNIKPTANSDEIKKAYRKLSMETHPDRNKGSAAATTRFQKISEAYNILSDSQKRQQYDMSLRYPHRETASLTSEDLYNILTQSMFSGNIPHGVFTTGPMEWGEGNIKSNTETLPDRGNVRVRHR